MKGIKEETLSIIEEEMYFAEKEENKDGYLALSKAAVRIRRIGCGTCAWMNRDYCTYHFPGEEIQNPFYVCPDYAKKG